jgi:curved DNA-binding protein CbpA
MATMAASDPYKLLQVDPEADVEIIQVAYRKLAQRYHPDVAPGADAARRMAELNAARDLLVDPVARAAHDAARTSGGGVARRSPEDSPSAGAARTDGRSAGAPRADHPAPGAPTPPAGPSRDASGSVLTFGRYEGWSLGAVARADLEYVEWLDRMPIGRPYRDEIDAILRRAGRRGTAARPEEPHGLYRRR